MAIKLLIDNPKQVKPIKLYLEDHNWLNKSFKIQKKNDIFHIFTNLNEIPSQLSQYNHETYEQEDDGDLNTKNKTTTLTLASIITDYCHANNIENIEIPKRWSIYPPMILFNSTGSTSESNGHPTSDTIFNPQHQKLWENVLSNQKSIFGTSEITHIALNKPIIESDIMRRPHNLIPIIGDFGPDISIDNKPPSPTESDFNRAFWCHVIQNGIYQTWAPKYTMFSRGNIKEKKRVLDWFKNLDQTIVFDFYCGIGYFSLSYLKNGGKLLCWELNPWSIEGFRRSLEKMKINYKIYTSGDKFSINDLNQFDACLFLESNEQITTRVIDQVKDNSLPISHINLGLLPSSKQSWTLANKLINKSTINTNVHIHENVHIDDFEKIKTDVKKVFTNGKVLHLEKVKTFAPDIWHIVIDIENVKSC